MLRATIRIARAFPKVMERLHLQWALAELTRREPMHRDVPWIVLRIHELERM
jgi:hypothetical protein